MTEAVEIRRLDGEGSSTAADAIAVEEPLEIRVGGRSIAVTMRTPGHDAELAAGFLLTEGVVRSAADIVEVAHCESGQARQTGNVINVFLAAGVAVDFQRLTRHVFASSSCGLCGKAAIDAVIQTHPPVSSSLRISAAILESLPEKLRASQTAFAATGGLHAAAIFDANGRMLVAREDVGRHNAVDKVIGWALQQGITPLNALVLLVSGRVSYEIVQKALAAGLPMVCAVSAPTSLAVELARESGLTLVGFLRGRTMNLYSGVWRIGGETPGRLIS
jgi:FdhD protein